VSSDSTVTLSLISHTNVGKTTLARTLLRRDIGEVRDEPHVTEIAEAHEMIVADSARLLLWDTPGFGDTARLAKRLRGSRNSVGWLLSQVWDRFSDRALWCSQQAVRNVRDDADVVLYLVNAAEKPQEAGYVALEMEILAWIGKPTLVLLNQLGAPREPAAEQADEAAWRAHLLPFDHVKGVLGLDAFARCWVQEEELLARIGPLLPEAKLEAYDALCAAWRSRSVQVFDASMRTLSTQLAETARDDESLTDPTWKEGLRQVLRLLGVGSKREPTDQERAMAALAERLDQRVRGTTDKLIGLHKLEGSAGGAILERLRANYRHEAPVHAGAAGVVSGAITGALSGLAAEVAAGGLAAGGATIGGGLLGALAGSGLAKGYNLVRGVKQPMVRWSDEFLEILSRSALLRYLAVAHFGRGRGGWTEGEAPAFWQSEVAGVVAAHRDGLAACIAGARAGDDGAFTGWLERCAGIVLTRLYPETTSAT
jgi:GTPase SAR1 family protein